jgi:hypothetical protein
MPRRGFETVTYMIDGIFQHQDSNGGGGLIIDGDTPVDDGTSRLVSLLAADLRWGSMVPISWTIAVDGMGPGG